LPVNRSNFVYFSLCVSFNFFKSAGRFNPLILRRFITPQKLHRVIFSARLVNIKNFHAPAAKVIISWLNSFSLSFIFGVISIFRDRLIYSESHSPSLLIAGRRNLAHPKISPARHIPE